MNRPRFLALLIAACLVTMSPLGLSMGPVSAHPPLVEVSDDVIASLPPEELEDLKTIASQEGIDVAEAVLRFGWGQRFSDAVAQVSTSFPTSFASSAMNNSEHPSGVIYFAGPIPAGADELVADVGVPVELVSLQDAVTDASMRTAVEAAHYAVRDLIPTGRLSTSGDELTGIINISVPYDIGASTVEVVAERAVEAAVGELSGELTFNIMNASTPGSAPETVRGGGILNYPSAPSNDEACTSGWPVYSTSGPLEGIITARHCDNNLEYTGRDVLDFKRSLPHSKGDIQYMSSSESVGHTFYYEPGNTRDIDSPLGVPSVDQYLCFFGRKTQKHCDNVRDTYVCAGDDCNLVSMDDHQTDNGDSGGPWFYGSRAYGVHMGSYTSFFQERALWTPLYNTRVDLSVDLLFGPDG